MLLQKTRERVGARLSGDKEAGFTLVELLVVMLILGILAAIAIPAFFNQKEKANDSQAKAYAHTAQVAMETYATDNGGTYTGADPTDLEAIEPTLTSADLAVPTAGAGYDLTVTAANTGNVFHVVRNGTTGEVTFTCTTAGTGGCPTGGFWD